MYSNVRRINSNSGAKQNAFAHFLHRTRLDVGQVLAAAAVQVRDGLRAAQEPDVHHLPSPESQPGQVAEDLQIAFAVRQCFNQIRFFF